jgi:hypothetical protein
LNLRPPGLVVDYSFRWGEEGDARRKVGLRLCGERGVDEERRGLGSQAVVLSPGLARRSGTVARPRTPLPSVTKRRTLHFLPTFER